MRQVSERFGRLDALVNNAGIAIFKPLMETTFADWSRVLAVNLSGPFLCTQAAVPLLSERGGSVVNITSISGLRASTLRTAYGTSKAALAQLTKQQAVELAQHGIRVDAVAPGPVDTAMAKAVHSPEIRADYHDAVPLGRYGLEFGARGGDRLPLFRSRLVRDRPAAGRRRWLRGDRHRPEDAARRAERLSGEPQARVRRRVVE